MNPVINIWITKYALTKGIEHARAEDRGDGTVRRFAVLYHPGEWHHTEAEAIAHAEKMRVAKIASHHKSIAKLEKLRFGVKG